jgi:uncharacterized protein (TIGR02271 family)
VEGTDHRAKLQRARRDELVVEAADGEAIGRVDALYYDLESGRPAWIGVRSEDEPNVRTLVPVEGTSATGEVVRVPFAREVVDAAPRVEAEEIDEDTERSLAEHYGAQKALEDRDTAVISPIVRHEEALTIEKAREETGRVRLRKWVETEPVEIQVALERERVRVTRRPVGLPAPEGTELGEDEISIPVYAERPEVGKRVVAVERIRLEKSVRVEDVTIAEELRVEHVGVEDVEA